MRIRSDGTVSILGAGNTAGGNLALGDTDNGRSKWSYITGAHYNAATEAEGVAMIGVYGADGNNSVVIGGSIYETNPATSIQFWTHTASTHAQGGSEAMRIDGNGNLLVGKTSTGFANSNNWAVEGASVVQGHVSSLGSGSTYTYFVHGTSLIGSITQNGTTGILYNTSSDQRLKDNIADADDAGSKIDAIQVRKYDWKADGSHQDYGMVAQELQAVAPEAVSGDADSEEMMGVDYSKLVPMLIKEIQSLRNRVAQLETGE
jgi:hypothetical protein